MEKNYLIDISNEVKKARKDANLTQEDLALFAGVSRKFISELENNKKTLEVGKVLLVIAALGLSIHLYKKMK